ncbi:hypothetical protein JANAI62_28220 [Jannaschia pagri]|uniref:Tellurite resistance protein TerB n=1 Tax=Jannaschia pagri TaxID=2829797 RepID=A0ABQ4NP57_9RHOB|nr:MULTISPECIES: DUF533 domain-containing protein [unclassified Jannaschia]GIT92364.1 hypothetical protein JANAI61_28220 [Jannaschia sp. AI_61]GIT96199.1 hypothetical protein JANAI62_28220 [Jannaschia sp. AI_62]
MSLKKTAFKMALGFAAAKGYDAFRQRGGMQGVKQMISDARSNGGASGGSLGGLLGALGGGTSSGGSGMGGLLGGLTAMAGGTAAAGMVPDQAQTVATIDAAPTDEATAAAMIRAIGQAVRADGQIDPEERAILRDILDDAETDHDRAALDAALAEDIHPEGLARDVPRGAEAQVYAAALTAIDPDHPAERDFLKRFATALALSSGEVVELHRTAGKPL